MKCKCEPLRPALFCRLDQNNRLWVEIYPPKKRTRVCIYSTLKIPLCVFMFQCSAKCVIMCLFVELTNKPRLKPLDSLSIFDLSGSTSVFAPPRWANVRRRGVNRHLDRAAGIRWSAHFKGHKHVGYLCSSNCCMSHFCIHLCRSKWRSLQHNSDCVVEGVTATMAPGNPPAESLKATQEELSPAEERLSYSPRLHLWRLACLPADLAGKETELLGGFEWQLEPTLHLDAVKALNGSTAFGISLRGRNGAKQHVQLCRQEQDDSASENKHAHYFCRFLQWFEEMCTSLTVIMPLAMLFTDKLAQNELPDTV